MDPYELKKLIMQRVVVHTPRMQSSITNFLGTVFMKKLPIDEIKDCIQVLDEKEHSIHTMNDVGDFLAREVNECIPHNTPQWRMWIYENYNETESVLMFKEHHVLADGIGILEIIMLITDEFQKDAMVDFRPTTWFKQMFLYCVSPFFLLFYLIPILCKSKDKFSITDSKLSGEKKFAIGKRFSIRDMKRSAKDIGVSLNDMCSAALSLGLTDYFRAIGEDREGPITAVIPVNLRTTRPDRPEDIVLQNNFIIVLLKFMIGETLENELRRISSEMKKAKKSMKPLATMYIQQLIMRFLPLFITRPLLDFTSSKSSLAFSNVPGFRKDLMVNGRRANNMLFFTPTLGTVGLGISMLSHVDHFRIGVGADKLCVDNVDLLLEKIENNIEKCINLDGRFTV